jgi:hypothetical protein
LRAIFAGYGSTMEGAMVDEEADYLRRRERQERAAAKAAVNAVARQAHQHLAECYCELLHGLASHEPLAMLRRQGLV